MGTRWMILGRGSGLVSLHLPRIRIVLNTEFKMHRGRATWGGGAGHASENQKKELFQNTAEQKIGIFGSLSIGGWMGGWCWMRVGVIPKFAFPGAFIPEFAFPVLALNRFVLPPPRWALQHFDALWGNKFGRKSARVDLIITARPFPFLAWWSRKLHAFPWNRGRAPLPNLSLQAVIRQAITALLIFHQGKLKVDFSLRRQGWWSVSRRFSPGELRGTIQYPGVSLCWEIIPCLGHVWGRGIGATNARGYLWRQFNLFHLDEQVVGHMLGKYHLEWAWEWGPRGQGEGGRERCKPEWGRGWETAGPKQGTNPIPQPHSRVLLSSLCSWAAFSVTKWNSSAPQVPPSQTIPWFYDSVVLGDGGVTEAKLKCTK